MDISTAVATGSGSGRAYGGASAADRLADRRARLVGAALDLIGGGGIAAVTVGAVCATAGLSKRYFYESFADLDALLDTTLAEALQHVADDIDAESRRTPAPPLEVAVRAVLRVFDDTRVARLYLESPGHPGIRTARDRAVAGFVERFLELLEVSADRREAARVVVHVIVAGTTEVVALWLRGDLLLSREELVTHLVALGERGVGMIVEDQT